MIHNSKEEAVAAIHALAQAVKDLGADFEAVADDDSGMEYYLTAQFRDGKGVKEVSIHFQELDI